MEQLTLVLVLAIGFAARCWMRMRSAEKRASHLAADRAFAFKRIANQDATIAELLEQLAKTEQLAQENHAKWIDARERYFDQLSENAYLRSGGAAE